MRKSQTLLLFFATISLAAAEIVEFDLSPLGIQAGRGLHPQNEVIPGMSSGSGDEIGDGIFFDTISRILTLNLAYGSAFGFTDLSGPAFSWLLHGPSPVGETGPVLFNLQSLHAFAVDHGEGGTLSGSLTLDEAGEATLLSGLSYINIYTPANLGGELRGQLVAVPEPHLILPLAIAGVGLLFSNRARSRRRGSRDVTRS